MMIISGIRKQQNPLVGKSKIKQLSLKIIHAANLGKCPEQAENNWKVK